MQKHQILIQISKKILIATINFINHFHKKYKTFNNYQRRTKSLKIKFFLKKNKYLNLKTFKVEMNNNNKKIHFFLFYSLNHKIQEMFLKKDLRK